MIGKFWGERHRRRIRQCGHANGAAEDNRLRRLQTDAASALRADPGRYTRPACERVRWTPPKTRTCRCARTRASSDGCWATCCARRAGDAGFERVEAIRQTAIRFRRAAASDAGAVKDELGALLNDLSIAETLDVVRAFSYFSHLANIAEDVHQNRRRRAQSRSQARDRSAAASPTHSTASRPTERRPPRWRASSPTRW